MDNDVHTHPKDQIGQPLGAEPGHQRLDLRGKSVSEIASILTGDPTTRDDGMDDPLSHASPTAPPSPPAVPEPSGFTDAPPTMLRIADAPHVAPHSAPHVAPPLAPHMAPGIGGPNVDLQPVKSPPFKAEVAVEDLAPRLPHDAGLPQPTIQTGQRPAVARFGGLPFVTILTVILAVTLAAIVAGALIMFTNEVSKRAGEISATLRPLFEDSSRARMQTKVPRLVVKAQKAFVNEPLPLGVSINDASGEERVTLAGVAIGTTLSAGTPVGLTSWQMSARDVGNVSVYPPKDFVGIMGAAIDLHSPSDWLMDSQTIWFEWIPNERRVAPQLGP